MGKYRREFSTILKNSRSQTSKSRFIRLFLIALILSLYYCTTFFLETAYNARNFVGAYSFKEAHDNPGWWFIARYPETAIWKVSRWCGVAGAYIIFFLFAIGTEAAQFYRTVAKKTGADKYLPAWCCGARKKTNTSSTTAVSSGSNWTLKSYWKGGRKQTSTMASK